MEFITGGNYLKNIQLYIHVVHVFSWPGLKTCNRQLARGWIWTDVCGVLDWLPNILSAWCDHALIFDSEQPLFYLVSLSREKGKTEWGENGQTKSISHRQFSTPDSLKGLPIMWWLESLELVLFDTARVWDKRNFKQTGLKHSTRKELYSGVIAFKYQTSPGGWHSDLVNTQYLGLSDGQGHCFIF